MPAAMQSYQGVSREALIAELEAKEQREKNRRKAERAEEGAFWGKVVRMGVGAGTAIGSGFLFAKFPNIATIGKTGKLQTRALIAGVAGLSAFFLEDEFGDGAEGLANGTGLPFLSDLGEGWA